MKTQALMAGIAMAGAAHAADITVLATPAIKEAYAELAPLFEKQTKHKVSTTWVGLTCSRS
jgi:ABC-type molybdate transport system substrate-binding protein